MTNIDTAWEKTKRKDFLREERQITHPIRKLILEHAVKDTVVDVGCASCIDYPMWRDAKYKYIGVDFTKKFLEYAHQLYPGIKTVNSDASDISLPDGCCNTSYCKDLLEHLPPEKYIPVIDEMWRISKNVMMIGFYIAPKNKPTEYNIVKGLHYKNHYNKQEIIEKLESLNPSKVEIIENIGYNNSALYVVKH